MIRILFYLMQIIGTFSKNWIFNEGLQSEILMIKLGKNIIVFLYAQQFPSWDLEFYIPSPTAPRYDR